MAFQGNNRRDGPRNVSCIVNSPLLFSFHLILSSPSLVGTWDSNSWKNEPTPSISQPLKFLKNPTPQLLLHPSSYLSNNDSTEANLSMAVSNSTRYIIFKGWSPHQQLKKNQYRYGHGTIRDMAIQQF